MCKSLFAAALLSPFLGLAAAADDAGIQDVNARHQATVGAIATLHAKVRVSFAPESDAGVETIEYWRSGGEVRRKLQSTKGRYGDLHIKGATLKTYDKIPMPAGVEPLNSGTIVATGDVMSGDPWALCLFSVIGAKKFHVPLNTVLDEPHKSARLKHVSEGGRDYAVISVAHEQASMDVWVSKTHNYLIGKFVIWSVRETTGFAKSPLGESVVNEFVEAAPGTYFPSKVTTTAYSPATGKVTMVQTVDVQEVRINKPIPASPFAFKFPPNVTVVDVLQGKVWRTTNTGETGVEAATPDGTRMTLETGSLPAPVGDVSASTTVTLEEPKSPTRWILPVSLCLIGGGLAILAVKRVRSRRET